MAKELHSIFTDNLDKCIITGMTVGVHRHHVFEGMQGHKKLSENYDFIAPLHCSLHGHSANARIDTNWKDLQHWLQRMCQEYFIEIAELGTREEWYNLFGKFYDDRTDEKVWLNGKWEWDI